MTEDEINYIKQNALLCTATAIARQVHLNPKTLSELAKLMGIKLSKNNKSQPPAFTGESSFVAKGQAAVLPRKARSITAKQEKSMDESFLNPLFKVNFKPHEVLIDRLIELWRHRNYAAQ